MFIDWPGVTETAWRTVIGFVTLLILVRLLGKKQISNITLFTYITGIAMGNIAGDMVVHRKDITLEDGLTGLVLWAALTFAVEYISLKSSKARIILDGEPTIIIKKGKIMQDKLTKLRLNMDDVTMLLRSKDVFSIKDVEYAILEPNGEVSILKKPELHSITKKDMDIPQSVITHVPTELIVDGYLVEKNMRELDIPTQWLINQLEKYDVTSIQDVFYAEIQSDGTLFVDKKDNKP